MIYSKVFNKNIIAAECPLISACKMVVKHKFKIAFDMMSRFVYAYLNSNEDLSQVLGVYLNAERKLVRKLEKSENRSAHLIDLSCAIIKCSDIIGVVDSNSVIAKYIEVVDDYLIKFHIESVNYI